MFPPSLDSESHPKVRQRANTASFPSFGWRKQRLEQATPPSLSAVAAPQNLDLNELIKALTPPSVPSLSHARSMASILSITSSLPPRAALNPVLITLCDIHSPVSVQAAGYDILSAYWENNEAENMTTAERVSYLALFLGSNTPWGKEIWEPRFKALRALTKYGSEIIGIETDVIQILKWWIQGAFDGLVVHGAILERAERAERERSIDLLIKFLFDILCKPENVARICEAAMTDILQYFANLVDSCIALASESIAHEHATTSTDLPPIETSVTRPSATLGHRRNQSSLSVASISSSSISPPAPIIQTKHPANIAISLYLNYLVLQIKFLSLRNVKAIVPLLFRAMAFCLSPLPRMTILSQGAKKNSLEERISEALVNLLSGPYSTTCMMLLRERMFPPNMPFDSSRAIQSAIATSLGAHRMLRIHIRRALSTRLARAYISRENTLLYSHSGAPRAHLEIERDLMDRVWPLKEEVHSSSTLGGNGWDAGRVGRVLSDSVDAWVKWGWNDYARAEQKNLGGRDAILEEAAGILKDILQEIDARENETFLSDDEEARVLGETLQNLASYVLPLKNSDGTNFIVPLMQSTSAPSPLLRTIASLLSRDHPQALNPLLSDTLINIADHLTDADTARLPLVMMDQHDLTPTSPDWLQNWEKLLSNPLLRSSQRPETRRAIMNALFSVYQSVRDMEVYRRPLSDLVLSLCCRPIADGNDHDMTWKILGEEVVLRLLETEDEDGSISKSDYVNDDIETYLKTIVLAAIDSGTHDDDSFDDSPLSADNRSLTSFVGGNASSLTSSPSAFSRTQNDTRSSQKDREKDSALPSVMSLLSSLAAGAGPQSQTHSSEEFSDEGSSPVHPGRLPLPRSVSSASALVTMFSTLAFSPYGLQRKCIRMAIRIYLALLQILTQSRSTRSRLTVLQFLMRLRADRDHKVYFVSSGFDADGLSAMLAMMANRYTWKSNADEIPEDAYLLRKTRSKVPQERDGRQQSRGRGVGGISRSTHSRSRSRTTARGPPPSRPKAQCPLWSLPEVLPFAVNEPDSPSEGLLSYYPDDIQQHLILPISLYLSCISFLLEHESNWEILSYVLCHLPVQLANTHLFCGPNCKTIFSNMLSVICGGILNNTFAMQIHQWPGSMKARDAQDLAYHTLTVLVSYRRYFELHQRHILVEVFLSGLNGQLSAIKSCLHALSLSAFELQSSMAKYMPQILEKLSQIMSNPNMAVHILGFLSIIGSLPPLYANFTESDFKMVFGVALQYLQHYKRLNSSLPMSWALSQHVRILSYTAVYVWFLAVKLPDRPRHIRYITRQLLLANEGNQEVDEATEVCFDWLARYTYASADPRPATSLFSTIVMNPTVESETGVPQNEKTWILGNSVVTLRSLSRLGWVEVLSRRPSGFSRFLCRIENVPLVGPGDVAPDRLSIPGSLIMERDPPRHISTDDSEISGPDSWTDDGHNCIRDVLTIDKDDEGDPPVPDPITGYVWSKSAPSQRRKQVTVDPSYLLLQLSPYPDGTSTPHMKMVSDSPSLSRFINSLDRIPVIDTHKVGIMYVAPGQTHESDILRNTHGSPAYTRFLGGIGRLVNLRGQVDVYAGGLDPNEDGEYAYAWWDDIGQILYHTSTMMPTKAEDPHSNNKKRHIGNDYVRIVWNDSGMPYRFDTLSTQFQFVNIVIEPHSLGAIAAFSNNVHGNEYFKITIQRAPGMTEFAPIGHFKLIAAEHLPLLVRQLSLLADWYVAVYAHTQNDTVRVEMKTNWQTRLDSIRRFRGNLPSHEAAEVVLGVMGQETFRDFTTSF